MKKSKTSELRSSDPEIQEVLNTYAMLKQFDAAVRFAKEREAKLSKEVVDKCLVWLKSLPPEQLSK
jgi:hypothetical protein